MNTRVKVGLIFGNKDVFLKKVKNATWAAAQKVLSNDYMSNLACILRKIVGVIGNLGLGGLPMSL